MVGARKIVGVLERRRQVWAPTYCAVQVLNASNLKPSIMVQIRRTTSINCVELISLNNTFNIFAGSKSCLGGPRRGGALGHFRRRSAAGVFTAKDKNATEHLNISRHTCKQPFTTLEPSIAAWTHSEPQLREVPC